MYRMMFETLVDPNDIADFIRYRFLVEHAKVAIEYSSYVVETRTVSLHHSSGLDIDDDMKWSKTGSTYQSLRILPPSKSETWTRASCLTMTTMKTP